MLDYKRNREDKKNQAYFGVPRQGWGFLVLMIMLSVAVHLGSYVNIDYFFGENMDARFGGQQRQPVKVRIVSKPKPKPKKQEPTVDQKILETPLAETEKPTDARYKGAQDHKTAKETKTAERKPQQKGLDPGHGGTSAKSQKQTARQQASPPPVDRQRQKMSDIKGNLAIGGRMKPKPRNNYEALMPTSTELNEQMAAGYQDYIDEDLAVGDSIDINTSDFRYIGYFTTMRKAIELVWNYPYEAVRRGVQGEVGLQFTILKDGTTKGVKVINSSGYPVLDKAIVEAIKLASPFSPLPEGFEKDKLVITGSFRYVLTSYAGAL